LGEEERMEGEKYRIVWSISGENQIPPGPGAHGFGEPLSFKEAQDILSHYHPTATSSTFLRSDDFKKIRGLTHRAVLIEPFQEVSHVSEIHMGISLQGMREIVSILGGQNALKGLSTGDVFRRYVEATKIQDPITPLTQAVRNMLGF